MKRIASMRDTLLGGLPALQRVIRAGVVKGWVPKRVWERLQPLGVWTLHAPDGRAFRYCSVRGDAIARSLIWSDLRDWEETTQPVIYDLARRARCFVDVGAFTGIYTLLACTANPNLRAYAIEPNADVLPMLEQNIRENSLEGRVTVVSKALSSAPGVGMLSIPADATAASLTDDAPDGCKMMNVALTTGDELLAHSSVDLIKLDVEGHEPEVLAGFGRALQRDRPRIIAECLTMDALDATRRATRDFGYRHVYHLGPNGLREVGAGTSPLPRYANFLLSTEPYSS